MEQPGCRAVRADGTPCQARALPGKSECWAHSAELAAQRERAKSVGGCNSARAARAQKLLPSQLKPVMALLIQGMRETHEGTLEPAKLSAMAAAAGAVTRMFSLVELEARVEALERDVRS
jgi:hypothetical protein